jgi:hypothetical protein
MEQINYQITRFILHFSGFIKEGRHQAIIQITMTNSGFKAFKPELYGNELTVIRTLSKTSTFKIRAEDGKTADLLAFIY